MTHTGQGGVTRDGRAAPDEKQLRVLELKELHGFSWNQIVATLNIDRSTAVSHYRAARRKLLNHLEQLDKDPA